MVKKVKTPAAMDEVNEEKREAKRGDKHDDMRDDSELAGAVRLSAAQIWQAGLGAFAKAQEEGGRVFSKLVQEGTELQQRTRAMAADKADKVSEVGDGVHKVAEGLGKQAAGSWDKLEQVFEDRVARALATIGVPTQKELDALSVRVAQLSQAVAELSGKKAPAPKTPPVKSAAPRKSAVKKAALKPPAAKKAVLKKAAPRKTAAARAPGDA